jgi:hypothetical protein
LCGWESKWLIEMETSVNIGYGFKLIKIECIWELQEYNKAVESKIRWVNTEIL